MLPGVPQARRETANGSRSSKKSRSPDYMGRGENRNGAGALTPHGSRVWSPANLLSAILSFMDAVTMTRQLVDIESITGNEAAVGNYLYGELCRLGYRTQKMPVEGARFNVYATEAEHAQPSVVFSTHMDTVPPFIPSSEDAGRIYGRGSCDA